MRRSIGVLLLFCFLVFSLSIPLTAEEIEKLVIEEDTVISEDTTWTGDVIINEGITLTVRDCALTVEEGNITVKGSFNYYGDICHYSK